MRYKCEVKGHDGTEIFILNAQNSSKAVNRAKRKYLRKQEQSEWNELTGRVIAVWRWLPGWVKK